MKEGAMSIADIARRFGGIAVAAALLLESGLAWPDSADSITATGVINSDGSCTLTEDPWIFSEHITVTTRNDGVVRLEGIVADTGELFRVLSLCRQMPDARRVINELEMIHNPNGGTAAE
jgi:hypothetical protein